MKSPFPGMDPYLEMRWSDVHVKLIGFIGEAIQPLLPPALRARAEERVLLESLEEDERLPAAQYRSEVAVVETAGARTSAGAVLTANEAASDLDPVLIRRQPLPPVERWVQIIDVTNGNRVITAIEILSPHNKSAGRLNRDYVRKLDDYARGGVSVVEIDLLRKPSRARLPVTEHDLPPDRRAAYLTCVRLGWEPEIWRAYPMPLRLRLPRLPIPLRRDDAAIRLDLQSLIERVYAAGGHDDIDYGVPPEPPLNPDEARWAAEQLAGRSA
jgi:hypothetical protein